MWNNQNNDNSQLPESSSNLFTSLLKGSFNSCLEVEYILYKEFYQQAYPPTYNRQVDPSFSETFRKMLNGPLLFNIFTNPAHIDNKKFLDTLQKISEEYANKFNELEGATEFFFFFQNGYRSFSSQPLTSFVPHFHLNYVKCLIYLMIFYTFIYLILVNKIPKNGANDRKENMPGFLMVKKVISFFGTQRINEKITPLLLSANFFKLLTLCGETQEIDIFNSIPIILKILFNTYKKNFSMIKENLKFVLVLPPEENLFAYIMLILEFLFSES